MIRGRLGVVILFVLACGGMVGGAAGCRQPTVDPRGVPLAPPPSYADVAAAHNARVAALDPLWARVTVQVSGRDAEGRRLNEQAEGHLQLQRPASVSLTLGKLGETYFQLGSNDERYWWFDMLDEEVRAGVFGRHELANPWKLEQLGVPVHPKDLRAVLNVDPWPTDPAMGGRTFWSSDGQYVGVSLPAQNGRRVVWLDPETLQPRVVEIQGPDMEARVRATLSRERFVPVQTGQGGATVAPTLASNYRIRVIDLDAVISLSLWEPQVRELNPVLFDFDRLVQLRRIISIRDLDAGEPTDKLPRF